MDLEVMAIKESSTFPKATKLMQCRVILLWESYASHHNGLFSPLLEISLTERQINIGIIQTVRDFLPFLCNSFLCNIICYLIFVFAFSLETLSEATTHIQDTYWWGCLTPLQKCSQRILQPQPTVDQEFYNSKTDCWKRKSEFTVL